MRVLVTSFEPFGGDPENASAEAVRRLASTWNDRGIEIVAVQLPVTFADAPDALAAAVAEHNPDAVLSVGEAGGRIAVTPERYGRNIVDARIADNAGAQPKGERIDDGPDVRETPADVDAMVAAIAAAGIPAEVSEDAGTYLCNRIAHAVAQFDVPGVFVHVPAVRTIGVATVGVETDSVVVRTPSTLTFDDLARALAACVRSLG